MNKHGNVQFNPQRMYNAWNRWDGDPNPPDPRWPAGLAVLQAIIAAAENNNLSVRGLGGGWSLSDAAVSRDYMVDSKGLNYLKIGLDPSYCDPYFANVSSQLIFAQCGISVLELNNNLEANDLALKTSGASNGQTICGAVSTGTHGSGNQIGSMQDFVLGLHLVSAGGNHFWIEPQSRPAVTQAFCDHLGTTLIRDDDLFNAVRVSFGSFGLVHAVLFQATSIYLLDQFVQHFDYSQVRNVIGTLDVSSLQLKGGTGLPYHFSLTVNPYAAGDGQKGAYVTWMFQRPFHPSPPPDQPVVTTVPGDELLGVIGTLTDAVPGAIPAAVTALLDSQLPENLTGSLATPGQTFAATNITTGGTSCELGVAIADAPAAVDTVIQVAQQNPYAGAIALRFVPPSDALLAFTKFAPYTCTIELVAVNSNRTRDAYNKIWDALEAKNIPHAFHWGQIARPSFQQLQGVFGDRVDRWLAARRKMLTTPKALATFSNDLLQSWGLDT